MVTNAKRRQVPTKVVAAEKSLKKEARAFHLPPELFRAGQDDEWPR